MYSFSTCWNSKRHTDGKEMLQEIAGLGFDYAELSHGIRISLMPGILEAVKDGVIKISSVHNFCPLPIGVNQAAPNIFRFTSDDDRERDNAFRHSMNSIETADKVGAQAVVLHCGSVNLSNFTEKLKELLEQGKQGTPKFEKLCLKVMEKREKVKEGPMERSYDMLHRLEKEAAARGLKLGIENREALEEIPFESDFFLFFKEFDGAGVGYWHDTGHAQIKENLGFINHQLHLESQVEKLIGFHIHDVEFPARDHRAPGTGAINFEAMKSVVGPDHIKVFEFSPGLSEEEARGGIDHIKKLWGEE